MIPYYLQGRMGSAKDQDSRLRQHDTDIERLWQAIAQVTKDGLILGNDPAADIYPPNGWGAGSGSGGASKWAKLTSDLLAPNGHFGSSTGTADVWEYSAGTWAVSTDPALLGLTVVNPDKLASCPVDHAIQIAEYGSDWIATYIPFVEYWGKTTATFTAPGTSLSTPTSATFDVYDRTSGGLAVSTDTSLLGLTAQNYDKTLRGTASGIILRVKFENEYIITWAGC